MRSLAETMLAGLAFESCRWIFRQLGAAGSVRVHLSSAGPGWRARRASGIWLTKFLRNWQSALRFDWGVESSAERRSVQTFAAFANCRYIIRTMLTIATIAFAGVRAEATVVDPCETVRTALEQADRGETWIRQCVASSPGVLHPRQQCKAFAARCRYYRISPTM